MSFTHQHTSRHILVHVWRSPECSFRVGPVSFTISHTSHQKSDDRESLRISKPHSASLSLRCESLVDISLSYIYKISSQGPKVFRTLNPYLSSPQSLLLTTSVLLTLTIGSLMRACSRAALSCEKGARSADFRSAGDVFPSGGRPSSFSSSYSDVAASDSLSEAYRSANLRGNKAGMMRFSKRSESCRSSHREKQLNGSDVGTKSNRELTPPDAYVS